MAGQLLFVLNFLAAVVGVNVFGSCGWCLFFWQLLLILDFLAAVVCVNSFWQLLLMFKEGGGCFWT